MRRFRTAALFILSVAASVACTVPADQKAASKAPAKQQAAAKSAKPAKSIKAKPVDRTPDEPEPVEKKSYPLLDGLGKVAPSKINRENYGKLVINMTLTDVESILGPGKERRRVRTDLTMEWVSQDRKCVITVLFQGAKEGYEPTLLNKSIHD